MSCNCNRNGNSCGVPKQPNYNNLNKGFIVPKKDCCDCCNIDLLKHITIDNNHLYPNDGIYVDADNKILHLQIIPNYYEYYVDLNTITVNGENIHDVYLHFDENINTNDIKHYNVFINKQFSGNLQLYSNKEFIIICNAIKSLGKRYISEDNLYCYSIPPVNKFILLEFNTKNNTISINSDKNFIDSITADLTAHDSRLDYIERYNIEEGNIILEGLFNIGSINCYYIKIGNSCTLSIENLTLNGGLLEQYYTIPFAADYKSTIRICGVNETNTENVELIATILSSTTNSDINSELDNNNPSCLVIHRNTQVLYNSNSNAPLPNGSVSFTITYKIID